MPKVRLHQDAAYNPFSDPQSSYNNPDKGPHDGVPHDPSPMVASRFVATSRRSRRHGSQP